MKINLNQYAKLELTEYGVHKLNLYCINSGHNMKREMKFTPNDDVYYVATCVVQLHKIPEIFGNNYVSAYNMNVDVIPWENR